MFFYAKKVVYLSVYEQDEKRSSAGFLKLWGDGEGLHLFLSLKNLGSDTKGKAQLFFLTEDKKLEVGAAALENGAGELKRQLAPPDFSMEELKEILVELPGKRDRTVKGSLEVKSRAVSKSKESPKEAKSKERPKEAKSKEFQKEAKSKEHQKEAQWHFERMKRSEKPEEERRTEKEQEKEPEKSVYEEPEKEPEKAAYKEPDKKADREDSFLELKAEEWEEAADYGKDKWEQLQRQYENLHPFGDERVFISIGPRDFVVLSENYQKLVHNSFLLHGYYNYRHMILGKDGRIGNQLETCFYLGVPGVFYEREKMVAVMFGFEGFECEGPVEPGKFGYYLRRVEI